MKILTEMMVAICESNRGTGLALAFLPATAGLLTILAIGFAPWP